MSQRTPILCCSSYMNSLYTWTMRYGHTARNHSWCEANAAKLRSIHFWFKLIVQRQAALTVCVMGTAAEIRAVKVTPNLVRRPEIPCQRNPPPCYLHLTAAPLCSLPFTSSFFLFPRTSFFLFCTFSFFVFFFEFLLFICFFFVHPKDSGLCFHIIYIYLPKTLGAFSSTAVLEQLIIPHSSSPSLCPCVCTHTHTPISLPCLSRTHRAWLCLITHISLCLLQQREGSHVLDVYTRIHTHKHVRARTPMLRLCANKHKHTLSLKDEPWETRSPIRVEVRREVHSRESAHTYLHPLHLSPTLTLPLSLSLSASPSLTLSLALHTHTHKHTHTHAQTDPPLTREKIEHWEEQKELGGRKEAGGLLLIEQSQGRSAQSWGEEQLWNASKGACQLLLQRPEGKPRAPLMEREKNKAVEETEEGKAKKQRRRRRFKSRWCMARPWLHVRAASPLNVSVDGITRCDCIMCFIARPPLKKIPSGVARHIEKKVRVTWRKIRNYESQKARNGGDEDR